MLFLTNMGSLVSEMASGFPYQFKCFAMTSGEITWKTIVEPIHMCNEQGLDKVFLYTFYFCYVHLIYNNL